MAVALKRRQDLDRRLLRYREHTILLVVRSRRPICSRITKKKWWYDEAGSAYFEIRERISCGGRSGYPRRLLFKVPSVRG